MWKRFGLMPLSLQGVVFMMTAMVVAMIAVATTGQGSIEGIRDIQSPMPVRQVVLDAGVLYGINAQPTNGQCALLLVCPLDESKPKDALPLFGMCAMEFGGSPFCWNVENGKFNLVSITEPPPSIQGISRVGHASTSQLERFRPVRSAAWVSGQFHSSSVDSEFPRSYEETAYRRQTLLLSYISSAT